MIPGDIFEDYRGQVFVVTKHTIEYYSEQECRTSKWKNIKNQKTNSVECRIIANPDGTRSNGKVIRVFSGCSTRHLEMGSINEQCQNKIIKAKQRRDLLLGLAKEFKNAEEN